MDNSYGHCLHNNMAMEEYGSKTCANILIHFLAKNIPKCEANFINKHITLDINTCIFKSNR